MDERQYNIIANIWNEILIMIRKLNGENDFTPFKELSTEKKIFLRKNIMAVFNGEVSDAKSEHIKWCEIKKSQGYIYGNKKNDTLKTHNCLVDWEQLNYYQKLKDVLFIEIIKSYREHIIETNTRLENMVAELKNEE